MSIDTIRLADRMQRIALSPTMRFGPTSVPVNIMTPTSLAEALPNKIPELN